MRGARSLLHDRSVSIQVGESAGIAPAGSRSVKAKADPEATRKLILPAMMDGTEVVRPLPLPRSVGWWRRLLDWFRAALGVGRAR